MCTLGHSRSLKCLMTFLKEYEAISGQRINFSKSSFLTSSIVLLRELILFLIAMVLANKIFFSPIWVFLSISVGKRSPIFKTWSIRLRLQFSVGKVSFFLWPVILFSLNISFNLFQCISMLLWNPINRFFLSLSIPFLSFYGALIRERIDVIGYLGKRSVALLLLMALVFCRLTIFLWLSLENYGGTFALKIPFGLTSLDLNMVTLLAFLLILFLLESLILILGIV